MPRRKTPRPGPPSKHTPKTFHPISDDMRETAWDELVRLLIRGATIRQCADKLGFHRGTIERWIQDESFQVKLMRTRNLVFQGTRNVVDEAVSQAVVAADKDLVQRMEAYARAAVDKMFNLMMTAQAETVQLKAAESLADRNPATQKTRKVDVGSNVMVVTPELMAVAMATAEELRVDHRMGKRIEPLPLEPGMAEPVLDDEPAETVEVEVELEEDAGRR